jgi:hypothetical protein
MTNSLMNESLIARPTTPPALAHCQRIMASAGWEIEYVDMDLTKSQPTVDIRLQRMDGRWIWARIDEKGRCTMETFQRERRWGMDPQKKGRLPLTPLIDDVFLGRRRHEGPQAMLRGMVHYLADNALHPTMLTDLRAAWAGLMVGSARMLEG